MDDSLKRQKAEMKKKHEMEDDFWIKEYIKILNKIIGIEFVIVKIGDSYCLEPVERMNIGYLPQIPVKNARQTLQSIVRLFSLKNEIEERKNKSDTI